MGCALACLAVPSALSTPMWGNENLYLVEFVRSVRPGRMAGDWTLSRLTQDRPVFDLLFRPLAMSDSYTFIAVTGRALSWCALAGAFVFLARTLGIRAWWLTTGAFLAWLVPAPYSVAKEWVVGTFEAKPFAYALLFVALALAARGRPAWAALAAGVSVGVHAVLGIWVLGIVIVALGVIGVRGRRWLGCAVLALAAAAPGIVSVLRSTGADGGPAGDIRWYTRGAWAVHFDPARFPRVQLVGLVLLAGASLVMTLVMASAGPAGGPVEGPAGSPVEGPAGPVGGRPTLLPALRRLAPGWVVLVTAEVLGVLGFLGGLVVRVLGMDDLLMVMPFRVGPVLVVMGAMLRIAWLVEHRGELRGGHRDRSRPPGGVGPAPGAAQGAARVAVAAAAALLAMAGLLGPVARFASERAELVTDGWASRLSAPHRAYRWASTALPADAVVATDPTDQPFAELGRPIVASYLVPPLSALGDWRDRIRDLSGADVDLPGTWAEIERLSQGFAARPEAEVLAWRERYGVTHVITSGRYPFRELHREGNVSVYELPAP